MKGNAIDILLVEDNSADVELTLRGLKKHNLSNRVRVLRDGAEALDYLFRRGAYAEQNGHIHPHLILLDLKLPKVSGIEVLRQVKSDETMKVIPVVVLTSSREERDIVESYKFGVNSYIRKPVDFTKFLKAIGNLGFYWMLLNEPPVIPEG